MMDLLANVTYNQTLHISISCKIHIFDIIFLAQFCAIDGDWPETYGDRTVALSCSLGLGVRTRQCTKSGMIILCMSCRCLVERIKRLQRVAIFHFGRYRFPRRRHHLHRSVLQILSKTKRKARKGRKSTRNCGNPENRNEQSFPTARFPRGNEL